MEVVARARLAAESLADHFAPAFHDYVNGKMIDAPDDPAGQQTVGMILDAIAAAQERT